MSGDGTHPATMAQADGTAAQHGVEMARIIAIANQKGGVGKTTTAVNLAAALAERKIHTLLVDLDPQANATSAVGVEKQAGRSLYGPLHGEGSAFDMITPTAHECLALIPSEEDLAAAEIELAQGENYLARLRRVLDPVRVGRRRLPDGRVRNDGAARRDDRAGVHGHALNDEGGSGVRRGGARLRRAEAVLDGPALRGEHHQRHELRRQRAEIRLLLLP